MVPSVKKLRPTRPRFMPTARSMPSSDFRSSASITKMFTSSRTPAMIEKLPMNRNRAPTLSPTCLAASSTLCLVLSTATPWEVSGPSAALSFRSTASLRRLPPSTSPVLATKGNARGSGPAPGAAPRPPGRLDQHARADEQVAGRAADAGPGQAAGRDDPGDPHVPGLPVEVDGERLARAGAGGGGQRLG